MPDKNITEAKLAREFHGIEGMRSLIKQYHTLQRRNNNPEIPYTEHLYGVVSALKSVAESNKEIPEDVLEYMMQAALGHDLLEDTDIDENVILQVCDGKVLEFIRELTNPNDDAHTDEYMTKISFASEEARLIKYADLIENTSSFCYSLHEPSTEDPIKRAKEFYLPILNRTTEVLASTSFENYPKTAEAMQLVLKVYADLLLSRIELLEG